MNKLAAWIFGFLFLPCSADNPPPVKRALIIAIGNYPSSSGWAPISSANDVPYMKRAFQSQGFGSDNIWVLQDSMATTNGIDQVFNQLYQVSEVGDIVAIHISAHGEQIEDDNGDEVDGLDESIVTYGALSPGVSTNFQQDQAAYLRDDKFGEWIDKLRSKLGSDGDVVVFMDACHSGTGTRGMMKVRGGQPPFTSGKSIPKNATSKTDGVFGEKAQQAKGMATYIVFSAARAEELAAETTNENNEGMGSLTFALSKVFQTLEPSASYRSVFAGVQGVMHQIVRGQHPVLEGTGVDRRLFGGHFVSQKPFAEIESVNTPREIQIREGSFTGYEVGSTVLVCKAGTQEPSLSNIVDTGTIIKAGYYSASVKLMKGGIKSPADYWVFLLNPVYHLRKTKLKLADGNRGFTSNEAQILKSKLAAVKGVEWNESPDVILYKGKEKDSLKLASNGFLFQLMNKNFQESEWADVCRRFSRYSFFSSLDIKDRRYSHEIRFIPVRHGKSDTALLTKKMVNGMYEFHEGDSFIIEITNTGTEAFYFNVLDLQVLPGQTRIFDKAFIILSPPYGEEIFKFFFAAKPLDLELIAQPPPNASARAGLSFMEQLVDRSVQNTRGDAISLQGNTEGAISQVVFRILPN